MRDVPPSATPPSAWAPLHATVFRMLWLAGLASDFGSWMHEVGEAWLMTSLSPSPLSVALLQSADGLAIFLLAIPAGALADVMDRRRLAMVTQAWLFTVVTLLATLTVLHRMTPGILVGLTFLMGVGASLDGPIWQAITAEVVPRSELPQAVALGALSLNVARAFAPAIAGLLVAAASPAAVFFLNAATFLYGALVLVRWRRVPQRTTAPAERWLGAMHGGLRYVRNSPELLAVFVRTAASLFGGICLMALLPLFARRSLGLGSAGFGVLLGCMGVGAVTSAVSLPKLGNDRSAEVPLTLGTLVFALALGALSPTRSPWLAGLEMFAAGAAWMTLVSSFNVAVQMATPGWVRGRVLAVFMFVFQGALTLGSLTWGVVAARTDLRVAMMAGAATVAASLVGRLFFPLGAQTPNFAPAAWPKPALVCEPSEEAGPVLVTVTYRVAPENLAAFVEAAAALERLRRRGGAYRWCLFQDPATEDHYVEAYTVDSWAEHLRQHDRVTAEEAIAQERLRAFLKAGTAPDVRHLIAVPDGEG